MTLLGTPEEFFEQFMENLENNNTCFTDWVEETIGEGSISLQFIETCIWEDLTNHFDFEIKCGKKANLKPFIKHQLKKQERK